MGFGQVAGFVAKWKQLGLTDEDLQALEQLIMRRPEGAPVLRGTGGVRKIRFAPPSWHMGKSGAIRVCYVYFAEIKNCYLIRLFAKNEQPNLTAAQAREAKEIVEGLRKLLLKGKSDD